LSMTYLEIRGLEKQLKKPESRTTGVSTEDDASFDRCISYTALQRQNHAQKGQIDTPKAKAKCCEAQPTRFKISTKRCREATAHCVIRTMIWRPGLLSFKSSSPH